MTETQAENEPLWKHKSSSEATLNDKERRTLHSLQIEAQQDQYLSWNVWRLYCSHGLSAWGIRMWEFAIGLVLLRLQSCSLLLVSLLGLTSGISVLVSGGWLGSYIDRTNRLKSACHLYLLQNAAVTMSAGCVLLAPYTAPGFPFIFLVICIIATTAVSDVAALGSSLSVEKEWTKQLCQNDSARLASMNAGMKRIDLSCLILSPILVGFLMTYLDVQTAIIYVTMWNLLSWAPECLLLRSAQASNPLLREPKLVDGSTARKSKLRQLLDGQAWLLYFKQSTALQGLALALVYLTVLSFGILMTAYLNWKGLTEAELSVYRALGAAAGILATLLFPWLHCNLGLEQIGALGVLLQLLCLAGVLAVEFLLPTSMVGDLTGPRILVLGIVFSRWGLWTFDLAVGQMLQERVSSQHLGAVNGVQGSLCSLFQTMSYAVGTAIPRPANFAILMWGSAVVVGIAALLFVSSSLRSSAFKAEPDESQDTESA